MKKRLTLFCLFLAFAAVAEDPFPVMDGTGATPDKHGNPLVYGHAEFKLAEAFPGLPPDEQEKAAGFRATFIDLNTNWQKPFRYDETALRHELKLIAPQDDYVTAGLSIFMLASGKSLELRTMDLTGPSGQKIAADRIRFFTIVPADYNKRYQGVCMLLEPKLTGLKEGEQINLMVMVDVPAGTEAGLYSGNIQINGLTLPVSVRVMGFTLPRSGSFGFYLNANFYTPGDKSIQQCGYVEKNLGRYFDFYRTRRLNSVTLYDSLPDLRYVDGKVTGGLDDISKTGAAMKQAGLNGLLIVDLRNISYWANAVAIKLDELEKSGQPIPAGDLGVTIGNLIIQETPYSERAKKVFEQTLEYILEYAEKESWPDYRLLVEEEISNNYPYKLAGYESFMPVLMKVCPERAAVVDNGIGYGRKDAIDYGARDRAPLRQYNSWTDEGLADAHKNGAEVLAFNYALSRLSFGFQMQRLGAKGNHQWADMWDSYNFQWQYTKLSEKGVVSSLDVEKGHEGCIDFAACEYLSELIAAQEKSGNTELAEFGRQVLKDVSADLPVLGDAARTYGLLLTHEHLNARRWQVFLAIEKLLAHPAASNIVAGKPAVRVQKAQQAPLKETNYVVTLKNNTGEFVASGDKVEQFWSDTLGPLTFMTEHEAHLKARASTSEEYQRMNQASYTIVNLACLPEGLAIYSLTNNVRPEGTYYRYERVDDDGDMWQDDCMEYFFGLPNGKICRLLYNAAGAKTFINNGAIVPAADIRSYYTSPVNDSGGTSNKLLIPWRYFGLKQAPLSGTVWEFNVGREFHTHMTVLSWARVATSFHERDKWGRLVFSGGGTMREVKIAPSITVTPNVNLQVISGADVYFQLESRASGVQQLPLEGMLTHSSGRKMQLPRQTLPVGAAEFFLNTQGLEPGNWTLQLWIKGTTPAPANAVRFIILPSPWL